METAQEIRPTLLAIVDPAKLMAPMISKLVNQKVTACQERRRPAEAFDAVLPRTQYHRLLGAKLMLPFFPPLMENIPPTKRLILFPPP